MDIESHPFDLRECVESALDLVSTRATEKHLDIAYVFEGDVPAGDQRRPDAAAPDPPQPARQRGEVHRGGEVVLTVRSEPRPATARVALTFAVRDTGIGLSAEGMGAAVPVVLAGRLEHDAQVRRHRPRPGDQQAPRRADGRPHVGRERRARARARPSSFTIEAPVAELPASRRRDFVGVQPELQGKRMLIVDDNATNRRVLALQTAKWGMAVARHRVAARSAALARRQRRALRPRDPRHAHAGDGRPRRWRGRIRASAPALPLVLFSSLGRREAGDTEALFNAYLAKPIRQSHLFDTLVEPARARRAPPRPARRAGASRRSTRRWRRAIRCASCSPRTTS